MSLISAKEIFNYAFISNQKLFAEVNHFCGDDSPESVDRFVKFHQAGGACEYKNGDHPDNNILMRAASAANVHLISYIAWHCDPNLLNMIDHQGYTALFHLVKSSESIEKVIACARILIEAGANMHVSKGKGCNEEDPLGYVIQQLLHFDAKGNLTEKAKQQDLVDLFVTHGAKQACSRAFDRQRAKHVGRVSVEESDEGQSLRNVYVRELKNAKERVEKKTWSKVVLMAAGSKDQNSLLSQLPQDIQKILFQKILSS